MKKIFVFFLILIPLIGLWLWNAIPKTGSEAISRCIEHHMEMASYSKLDQNSIEQAIANIIVNQCKSQFDWYIHVFFIDQRLKAEKLEGNDRIFTEKALDELEEDMKNSLNAAKLITKNFPKHFK